MFRAFRLLRCVALASVASATLLAAAPAVDAAEAVVQPGESINAAVQAAQPGDVIVLAEGVHTGDAVTFFGKNLTLRSSDPSDPAVVAATIFDGGGAGPMLQFDGREDASCVVDGLTLRNGVASRGGAVSGSGTGAVLRRCVVTGCSAVGMTAPDEGRGGAVADFDGLIEDCTFTNCTARYEGGALSRCGGTIRRNVFTGCRAEGGEGGALSDCDGTIHANTITSNTATSYGAALFGCDGAVTSNTIARNAVTATSEAGAVASCNGTIARNRIEDNDAAGLSQCRFGRIEANRIARNAEGGILLSTGEMTGNAILDNTGAGIAYCNTIPSAGYFVVVKGNLVAGNTGAGLESVFGDVRENVVVDNGAAGVRGTADFVENVVCRNGGAGVDMARGALLKDNAVVGNGAEGVLWPETRVESNRIVGNAGNGVAASTTGTLRNNVIAYHSDSGVYNFSGAIENDTIVHNTSSETGPGLRFCETPVRNCILYGNEGPSSAQFITNGDPPAFSCVENWAAPSGGSFSEDPAFVDDGLTTEVVSALYDVSTRRTTLRLGGAFLRAQELNGRIARFGDAWSVVASSGGDAVQMWGALPAADPMPALFVMPTWRLTSASPCVDSGARVEGLLEDDEGDARPFNAVAEARGDGSNYDVGADEYADRAAVPAVADHLLGRAALSPSDLDAADRNTDGRLDAADLVAPDDGE